MHLVELGKRKDTASPKSRAIYCHRNLPWGEVGRGTTTLILSFEDILSTLHHLPAGEDCQTHSPKPGPLQSTHFLFWMILDHLQKNMPGAEGRAYFQKAQGPCSSANQLSMRQVSADSGASRTGRVFGDNVVR